MRVLSLLPLAALGAAQMPFPVMTRSAPQSIIDEISADVSKYVTSLTAQPAYTSAVNELNNDQSIDQDLVEQADGNPIVLAEAFLTATATPAWYTALPSDLQVCFFSSSLAVLLNLVQSFVSSVAAAQATIVAKDSGVAPSKTVWAWGAGMVAGLAGIFLL